jgi:ATP-binding cassette subfamily C protein CydCD
LTIQQTLLEILTGLGGLAVVATGGWLAAHGQLDSGILPLLTLLALAAFLPVSEIAQVGRQLADTLGSTRRVHAVEIEDVPVRDGAGLAAAGGPQSGQRGGALRLDHVDFVYPGAATKALAAKPRDPCRCHCGVGWNLRCRQDDLGAIANAVLGSKRRSGQPEWP